MKYLEYLNQRKRHLMKKLKFIGRLEFKILLLAIGLILSSFIPDRTVGHTTEVSDSREVDEQPEISVQKEIKALNVTYSELTGI